MSDKHVSGSISLISPELWPGVNAPRDPLGHKGTFGSVCIVGGASGMTGAALLAGRSALKAGAGRVYVCLAQPNPEITVDLLQPELMLRHAEELPALASQMDALAVGCGLGRQPFAIDLLRSLIMTPQRCPMVIDADALNALATGVFQPQWDPDKVVLTPHPAEAARLLDMTTAEIQRDRTSSIRKLADRYYAWIILKGHASLVCSPSGDVFQNPTGDVALATAGTGDVLTGLIASLLGQGHSMQSAVCAGVWLHGAAGQYLRTQLGGPVGTTASEVIEAIRYLRNHPQWQPPRQLA